MLLTKLLVDTHVIDRPLKIQPSLQVTKTFLQCTFTLPEKADEHTSLLRTQQINESQCTPSVYYYTILTLLLFYVNKTQSMQ